MDFIINSEETSGELVKEYYKQKCFAGICLYSSMSNRAFLESYIPWLIQNTQKVCLTIGDYLERHNLSIFKQLSIEDAGKHALKKGLRVHRYIENILTTMNLKQGAFIMLEWRELVKKKSFQRMMSELHAFSRKSQQFDNDVGIQVKKMLCRTRRISEFDKKLPEKKMATLKQYIYEELAYFITMYAMGYYVEIYPGKDLEIMRNIISGKYEGFPFDLKKRTHIGLYPVRIQKMPTDDFNYSESKSFEE